MLLAQGFLTIRDATPPDAALLCRWWNDGRVMAHAGFPNGLGVEPGAIARSLAADSDATGRRLVIEADGQPIGEMSYRAIGDSTAEIGIKICEQAQQGKGYGSALLKMLIGGLFSRGFGKIILDTNLNNTQAQHVYEKLGFRRVRVNRDSWTDQLGVPQSSVDYELLPEWFAR